MQTIQLEFTDTEFSRLKNGSEKSAIAEFQEKIQQFGQMFIWLSPAEQDAFLLALRKQILLLQAERLNRSVLSNRIDLDEILREITLVRSARHAV